MGFHLICTECVYPRSLFLGFGLPFLSWRHFVWGFVTQAPSSRSKMKQQPKAHAPRGCRLVKLSQPRIQLTYETAILIDQWYYLLSTFKFETVYHNDQWYSLFHRRPISTCGWDSCWIIALEITAPQGRMDKYQLLDKRGQGSYAVVWKARSRNNTIVAIKQVCIHDLNHALRALIFFNNFRAFVSLAPFFNPLLVSCFPTILCMHKLCSNNIFLQFRQAPANWSEVKTLVEVKIPRELMAFAIRFVTTPLTLILLWNFYKEALGGSHRNIVALKEVILEHGEVSVRWWEWLSAFFRFLFRLSHVCFIVLLGVRVLRKQRVRNNQSLAFSPGGSQ